MKINKNILVAVSAVVLVIVILVINNIISRPETAIDYPVYTDYSPNPPTITENDSTLPDHPEENIVEIIEDNPAPLDETAPYIDTPVPYVIQGKFPSLHITSSYDPFGVDRSFWHSGTLSLSNHINAFEDVDIRIRGRGNSTWHFGPDKRPLRLRFEEPQPLANAEHIARDWVLIANHFDLALMRTHLAFYLASLLDGMYWAPFSQFVNLYINGEYMGLYQLADERDIGPGRAQLVADPDPAVSEYFFELDHSAIGSGQVGVDYLIVNGMPYSLRYPGSGVIDGHMEYLHDFVANVEYILHTHDFEAISQVVDIPSFIDFYLVQELFKNVDVGFNSVFMQVKGQGENRRLYFGPVWDFDRSAGNMYYWYTYEHLHAGVRNNLFRPLISTPEIFDLVAVRWEEISGNQVPQMIEYIMNLAENYDTNFMRNFERHPIWESDPLPQWMTQMLPPHLHQIDNWHGQVEFLLEWFEGRVWWMNQFFIADEDLRAWWINYIFHGYGG